MNQKNMTPVRFSLFVAASAIAAMLASVTVLFAPDGARAADPASGSSNGGQKANTYIVAFEDGVSPKRLAQAERADGNPVLDVFTAALDGIVVRLTPEEAAEMRSRPNVVRVERDTLVQRAAVPANDTFANAAALEPSGTTGSNVGASAEAGEPAHAGSAASRSVWYRWSAPSSGTFSFGTIGSTFDTTLAVYTGTSVRALTRVAANDDGVGHFPQSVVTFSARAGTTYRFAVDGYGGTSGQIRLVGAPGSDPVLRPSNDRFANAAPLELSGTTGSNVDATSEAGEPRHAGFEAEHSVWYRWTAPSDGMLSLNTQGSSFNTILGAYTGATVGALRAVGSNDDADVTDMSGFSRIKFVVDAGVDYSIAVDGAFDDTGSVKLGGSFEPDTPPPTATPRPTNRAAASWGLDRLDQRAGRLDKRIKANSDGAGVMAYVIDGGVRGTHRELAGRVKSGVSLIDGGSGARDCDGHGTHVAGTIAGRSYGVAPSATIFPVDVFRCQDSTYTSTVIAAIEFVIDHHRAGRPAVTNLSLGGPRGELENQAVRNLVADGVSVVVAAGNDNRDACTASPASEPTAITVGATDQAGSRTSWSNKGSCLDLFAPGNRIRSAWNTSNSASAVIDGTSMASPHVAGAAALLLSSQPGMTPAQVAASLNAKATRGVVKNAGVGSPNRLLYIGR